MPVRSQSSSTCSKVVIIGGGLAGLAAAESLARAGSDLRITVLEATQRLGGRAGSFVDPASNKTVDYCQHVAMGCCTNLVGLLRRCGCSDLFKRSAAIEFLHPDDGSMWLRSARWLPTPMHLAPSFFRFRHLSLLQKLHITRALYRLLRTPAAQLEQATALQWLERNGQDQRAIKGFWEVVLVSALADPLDSLSMAVAKKVLVEGFLASPDSLQLLVPKIPLVDLIENHLMKDLCQLSVDLRRGTRVSQLSVHGDHVRLHSNSMPLVDADHVVVAVPWNQAAKLLPQESPPFADLKGSAITGFHLWFDRAIGVRSFAAMIGTTAQWIFAHPFGNQVASGEHYYQVVVSASKNADGALPTVEEIRADLARVYPASRDADLVRYRVVTNPKSVFRPTPESISLRPAASTAFPCVHLAGDWIATGWPATMESAVIGGRMAASSVLKQLGRPEIEIDPGIKPGRIVRWLNRS